LSGFNVNNCFHAPIIFINAGFKRDFYRNMAEVVGLTQERKIFFGGMPLLYASPTSPSRS
jgi:hypothetical protein